MTTKTRLSLRGGMDHFDVPTALLDAVDATVDGWDPRAFAMKDLIAAAQASTSPCNWQEFVDALVYNAFVDAKRLPLKGLK